MSSTAGSPMVEALKKGTVKAFGTTYFTKINQQYTKSKSDEVKLQSETTSEPSSIPFPELMKDDNFDTENRENKLQRFEEMASKLNETDNAELCKSPEQKVKEKRRRRATMFVKGSSTPDDIKSPSFVKPSYSSDLLHKKRIDFADDNLTTSVEVAVTVANAASISFVESDNMCLNPSTMTPASILSTSSSETLNKLSSPSSTTTVPSFQQNQAVVSINSIDREQLFKEFSAKYEEEKKNLQDRATEAENKLGMALAEHDALFFMNEVEAYTKLNFIQ